MSILTHNETPGTPPVVLVTGASGFVGKRLCARLLSMGVRVRALVRREGKLSPQTGLQAIVIEDLAAAEIDSRCMQDVAIVMHLAGFAHIKPGDPGSDARSVWRSNVTATETLARAAAKAGVARFVYTSSIKVNGESSGAGKFSADDEPHPEDEYGRSKLAAERALRQIAGASAMQTVVVRPPLVYGPEVKANFLRLLAAVDRGIPLPLGSLRNSRSLVYVDNLIDALVVCAEHPAAAGKTYLVSDGEDVSTADLIRRMASALGRPARLVPFPVFLLRLAGRILGKLPEIERLTGNLAVDSSPIREDLGWKPPMTMSQGLAETAAWYLASRHKRDG